MKIFKNKLFLIPIGLVVLYLSLLSIFHKEVFTYKFDSSLIDRYYLSQDITHEVPGKRLFLSDADVYTATGYLYAHGEDPSQFNFEHPPFIKYLFGYSIVLFKNPLIIQVILGSLVLATVFLLGLKLFKNSYIGPLAALLLLTDPLFLDVSSQTLLDMGQTLLLLLYFFAIFFRKKDFVLQGILLGLFAGTKFWITPIFFIILFAAYKIYKKDFDYKTFILHLAASFGTYCLLYTRTFVANSGNFNIVWHMLRTFKYRLQHNTSSYFGSSIVLFVTGYYKAWWDTQEWLRGSSWTILWPIGLIVSSWTSVKDLIRSKTSLSTLINIAPLGYLLFLGVQAPFPRYFLIILPFIYLGMANLAMKSYHTTYESR